MVCVTPSPWPTVSVWLLILVACLGAWGCSAAGGDAEGSGGSPSPAAEADADDDEAQPASDAEAEPADVPSDPTEEGIPPLALADGSQPPPAPSVPSGPLDEALVADLDRLFGDVGPAVDLAALARVGASGDARVAWLLADLLRFLQAGDSADRVVLAFEALTGTDVPRGFAWPIVTNWLIAWDLPAPPGYVTWKRQPFELIEPGWAPFFADEDAAIDWRLVSWGGVLIDDRPFEQIKLACPQGCIPALNDPGITGVRGGAWYADAGIVFGVVVHGEARAYPKHIMEVHEMVNDTLGGRRIGMPYCTLCGSAQAYFTDRPPRGFAIIELRTSGLLSRSNKVMFDFHTYSVFDTFSGAALSGHLQDERFVLEMLPVVTSTWGEWKAAYPDTTMVAADGGIGRSYPLDPLRGRDDAGPIFPIGAVDLRLPVQAPVLGIVTPAGEALAFPVAQSRAALQAGDAVVLAGVRLVLDGGGIRAEWTDGRPLPSHQAYWFAWSQFHPDTVIWTPLS